MMFNRRAMDSWARQIDDIKLPVASTLNNSVMESGIYMSAEPGMKNNWCETFIRCAARKTEKVLLIIRWKNLMVNPEHLLI